MQEFGEKEVESILKDKKLSAADVLCFVYDSSEQRSFAFVAELITQVF